jgi:Arc/MetJ-type ribon-helix-helix transcriptional regulator
MPTSSHAPKAKITVTLSPEVVRQLDALVETPLARSRSQLVEEALRRWLEERVQKDLERQTEEYYRSLSPAEQDEDKEWSTIAAEAAGRLWTE